MFQLLEHEQQALLRIAREAVDAHLSGRVLTPPESPEGNLRERRGVFVSIHEGSQLHGCIGNIQPQEPLDRTTASSAVAAAVYDPRFAPLTYDELPRVTFEVSVLSPFEPIAGPAEIEVGKHGLLMEKGAARGLLLPQVALQYGWDAERFLAETCRKAGIDPAGDNPAGPNPAGPNPNDGMGAHLYRFTAQVFRES